MRISDWSSDVCSSDLVLPVARIRVRPGVVEYELPVRVVLEVAGCGGDEAVAFPQRQMACRPAPLFADAVVAFEAIEEGVGDERIARSEEHTSELQSLMRNSYAVFCLKKKIDKHKRTSRLNLQR